MESVRCYIDPMCPWAYQTSRWLREVRAEAGLAIEWRFFSLEEVNLKPGKKHPWERPWSYGWSQMRIGALLRRDGQDVLDRWYAACGAAFFERGEPTFTPDGAAGVLASMGLSPSLVRAAIDDPTTAEEVRADHFGLVDAHGGHGVPTLVFSDGDGAEQALYGPVVVDAPRGAAAVRLWELVERWREFPDLFEMRRPKTGSDLQRIGAAFSTYLSARAWQTIENPAP
ncbi:MAG: DsbA family oxidoreductase [Acidimicrobiales bacterium]